MESPTPEPVAEKEQAKARRTSPKKPRPARAKRKLTPFDADVLRMVKAGDNTQDRLLLLTGVDPLQFASRADFLCSKGFLCRDSANPSVFRLGIAGYDEIARRKEAEERKAARKSGAPLPNETEKPAGADQTKKPSEKDNTILYVPGPEHKPAKQAEIDLFELLKKGAPKNGGNGGEVAARIKHAIAAAQAGRGMPFEKQVETLGGRDAVKEMIEKTTQSGACELCQSPFKLSVNLSESNPKYGYCFCGASYHRDCYEHLVSSQNACVRCGKRLQIRMDRASEDAVRAIKKLFD
jgi:hypothetical protein